MSELIAFDHVTKTYASGDAVQDLNLKIHTGELFVLVGESGSGKTTTLKMINRLIAPTSGTIQFKGQDITSYPIRELRWQIGYVLQQIALFPNMTVGQNIALIPELRHMPKAEVTNRVDELLDSVGLPPEQYRNRFPKALSGGEQQRVGILRAFANKPPVVLMDEPFSALDPLSRNQLQELVLDLHQRLNMTIVFVTHDMNEAMRLGDRIAVMRDGQLVQCDTPQAIAKSPATDWVAEFFAGTKARLMEAPLRKLTAFATPDTAPNRPLTSPDALLKSILPVIAQGEKVTIQTDSGKFKIDAQAVLNFLAANA
ncbi:ABC transporter ATP-binding protein [Lacticaseibacillus porcinae]|uniref:ABC transporter ATP-binding protein n=1 Tax=Lacticaseibacillus porcinae TaxID=1123687 RepID=UPI000F7A1B7B|nr:ABC transporter ATP-binding protein [Lacticaseibacillus porcinae]